MTTETYPTMSVSELTNAVQKVSEVLGENFASMDELLAFRKKAREEKNWDIADKIRLTLDGLGIVLKDSKDGTVVETK